METRWVRYGREAAEALRAEIVAAKGAEPLAPVTVVVPSNHVGVAARRLLASGRLGPTTVVPGRRGARGGHLPHHLPPGRAARRAGPGRPGPPSRCPPRCITAAMRARPARRCRACSRPVAEHPATESALVASYRELRDLSAGALRAVGGDGPARPRRRRGSTARHGPSSRRTGTTRRISMAGGRRGPRRGVAARRRRIGDRLPPAAGVAPRGPAAASASASGRRVVAPRRGHRAMTGPTRRCGRRSIRLGSDQADPARLSAPWQRSEPVVSAERTTIVVSVRCGRGGA